MTTIITGPKIYIENSVLCDTDLIIDGTQIAAFSPTKSHNANAQVLRFPATWHLIPGMIDLHIHGVGNKDVMDVGTDETALPQICAALPAEGVTSFLATTITAAVDVIERALNATSIYINKQQLQSGAEILGINLEGPFLSPLKYGAQPRNLIIPPHLELFKRWEAIAAYLIKIVTIAPEMPNATSLIAYAKTKGIIASLGHSNASYEQTLAAMKAGISHATHLFNAMHAISQRDPGNAIALLLANNVTAELIVDGVHVHPALIQLVARAKSLENIILITDAIRAKNMPDGEYDLGGQIVMVKDGIAKLQDGTLAGSTLKMNIALRNMVQITKYLFTDVLKMATENPAKKINVFDRKGSIAIGKDADLVVLNENYEVMLTMCRGAVAYTAIPSK